MMLSKFLSSNKLMYFAGFLGIYLFATGISWGFFSYIKDEPKVVETSVGKSRIDPNLPKTEECPINGKMYSKPERGIWEERRPLAAIIENHLDSRPASGLSYADVVYEAVAEGGITRFLAIFYCGASAQDVKIAPIRSARVYFIDWAAEYGENPLFLHSGGANNICKDCPGGVKPRGEVAKEVDALKVLQTLGWRASKGNALDAGTNLGTPEVVRNQYRLGTKSAWEHSYEGFTDKIFEEGRERGFGYKDSSGNPWEMNFEKWKFKDGSPGGSSPVTNISFQFWSNKPDYDVEWKYDAQTNSYMRFNGGKEHIDWETKKILTTKNVVIQFVRERGPVDKEGHMFYTTLGSGDALVFQDGNVIEARWTKNDQFDRTKFYNKKDNSEIKFVRGEIWIEAVPSGTKVNY